MNLSIFVDKSTNIVYNVIELVDLSTKCCDKIILAHYISERGIVL